MCADYLWLRVMDFGLDLILVRASQIRAGIRAGMRARAGNPTSTPQLLAIYKWPQSLLEQHV